MNTVGLTFPVAPTSPPAADRPIEKMTKAELEAVALEKGVDISGAKTNKDIIALLTAAPIDGAGKKLEPDDSKTPGGLAPAT